jgi:hypothetical protein
MHARKVGRHIGPFRHRPAAIGDQQLGILTQQLFWWRKQRDIAFHPQGVLPAWNLAP